MFNKNALRAPYFAAFLCILASCSGKSGEAASLGGSSRYADRREAASFTEYSGEIQAETSRKLITSAYLELKTPDLEGAAAGVDALLEKYGAYCSSVNLHDNTRAYTLKVPAAQYKRFLEELAAIGRTVRLRETTEDAGRQYYDLDVRLQTQKALLQTYTGYLGRASNIEEILAVEEKIAQLQAELDDTGGQLRRLTNLIDYSTVQLELRGPRASAPSNEETAAERVGALLSGFGNYLSTLLVILVGVVIYGAPALAALLVLYFILLGRIGLLKKLLRAASSKKDIKRAGD
jgi:hypothetical protein